MSEIFKICDAQEWQAAQKTGVYYGSEHDRRDGFIHFSTASQLAGTLARHYAGRANLVLIAFQAEALGDSLKWETARDGDQFPHLYADLPASAALWTEPLMLDPDGKHILPPQVSP
jgi:uncharacterized protein (DUF952 family)